MNATEAAQIGAEAKGIFYWSEERAMLLAEKVREAGWTYQAARNAIRSIASRPGNGEMTVPALITEMESKMGANRALTNGQLSLAADREELRHITAIRAYAKEQLAAMPEEEYRRVFSSFIESLPESARGVIDRTRDYRGSNMLAQWFAEHGDEVFQPEVAA